MIDIIKCKRYNIFFDFIRVWSIGEGFFEVVFDLREPQKTHFNSYGIELKYTEYQFIPLKGLGAEKANSRFLEVPLRKKINKW